jgi:hypothetical protein
MPTQASLPQAKQVLDLLSGSTVEQVNGLIGAGDLVKALLEHPDLSRVDRSAFHRVLYTVSPEVSTEIDDAIQIMGGNFHGFGHSKKAFGGRVSDRVQEQYSGIPFSAETLRACRDTHLLVWLRSFSLMETRVKANKQGKLFYSSNPWYGDEKEEFAHTKIETGWYLIRKDVVPDSRSKNWGEQQALLTSSEEVPSAGVMVQAIMLHFITTGKRLFENVYVRTSSVDSVGNRVNVGFFVAHGLIVDGWDGERRSSIGLASSRKSSLKLAA